MLSTTRCGPAYPRATSATATTVSSGHVRSSLNGRMRHQPASGMRWSCGRLARRIRCSARRHRWECSVVPELRMPTLSLVLLVGASGSGKSTFARRHFLPSEVLSSDFCRGLVADNENDQSATKDAFEVLHFIAAKRLAAGRLTVVDATNVQASARKPLVALAREYDVLPVAIVF